MPSKPAEASQPVTTKQSPVSIGLALMIGTLIFGGALRVLDAINSLEASQALSNQKLQTAVDANTEAIKELTDRVTMNDLRVFAQLLQAQNPDLEVPDPGPTH